MIAVAEGFTEQAQVTNWPARLVLVAAMVLVIAAVLWGMRRGWLARQARQSDIPEPLALADAPDLGDAAFGGLYLGTASAGDWLDRVAVHGLGVRSRADVRFSSAGIGFQRQGAASFFIPAADVVQVRTDSGVAGTVRAKDSVIVVTWRLGSHLVDTGFRADDGSDHRTLLDGLMAALPASDASSVAKPDEEAP